MINFQKQIKRTDWRDSPAVLALWRDARRRKATAEFLRVYAPHVSALTQKLSRDAAMFVRAHLHTIGDVFHVQGQIMRMNVGLPNNTKEVLSRSLFMCGTRGAIHAQGVDWGSIFLPSLSRYDSNGMRLYYPQPGQTPILASRSVEILEMCGSSENAAYSFVVSRTRDRAWSADVANGALVLMTLEDSLIFSPE